MRLYNPEYEKNKEKYKKRNKRIDNFYGVFNFFTILAAIGVIIYLIIIKAAWYYYLIDIAGGLFLMYLIGRIMPAHILEYIDFGPLSADEITLDYVMEQYPDTKVIVKSAEDNVRGHLYYKGIFHGIAVCDCGKIYNPEDLLSFTVENRTSITSHTENGSMYTSEKADVKVTCKCSKCGKVDEKTIWGVTISTGSSIRKHIIFTDNDTVTSTSHTADLKKLVAEVYEQDKKRHKSDKDEYSRIIREKQREMQFKLDRKLTATEKRIAEYRAKGWYEKEEKATATKDTANRETKNN